MAEELEGKEFLDYEGLTEYHTKVNELFQDLTIEEVEAAFNELDESDPSYSAFYDVITKAKEAAQAAGDNATAAEEAAQNAEEAADRANEAAEKIEAVNDFTTGINLIRGTKDFKIGVDKYAVGSFATDGFTNSGGYTFSEDPEGFTVASKTNGTNSLLVSSVIKKVKAGDIFTISVDYRSPDITSDGGNIVGIYFYNMTVSSPISNQLFNCSSFGINKDWTTAVFHYTVPSGTWSVDDMYAVIAVRAERTGTIEFCKPMVQKGSINNPIWSASPFDVNYINDITMENNLLRGTRDFITGTELIPGAISAAARYMDGWTPITSSYMSRRKNDRGFTVIHSERSGLSSDTPLYTDTCVYKPEPGKTYTAVFDFMSDKDVEFENKALLQLYFLSAKGATIWQEPNIPFSKMTSEKFEAGKWFRLQYTFTLPETTETEHYLLFRPVLIRNGSINITMPGLYPGSIVHPEWSPAPADLALEPVNDLTTGANLLNGTKDFKIGIEQSKLTGSAGHLWWEDGFNYPYADYYSITKDAKGRKILNLHQSGLSSNSPKQAISSIFYGLKPGEIYTMFYEFMIDDVSAWDVKNLGALRQVTLNGNTTVVAVDPINFIHDPATGDKVNVNDLVSGKWYKVIAYMTCAGDQSTEYAGYCFWSLERNGSMNITEPGIYLGRIENPIWSISLSDIDHINKPTMGSNLLRGTRDFVRGSVDSPAAVTGYTDGFFMPTDILKTSVDNEGFTICTVSQTGVTNPNYRVVRPSLITGVNAGDKYTVGFDFMIEDTSVFYPSQLFGFIEYYPMNSTARAAYTNFIPASIGLSRLESGVWYHAAIPVNVPEGINDGVLCFQGCLTQNGSISFKKFFVYQGHIENAAWNASPFDAAQSVDFSSYKQYTVTNLVTQFGDYEVKRALLFVYGKRMAQILIEIENKKQLSSGLTYSMCKIDSKLLPVVSTIIGASEWGHGMLNSGDFNVRITPTRNVEANSTFPIVGTYILREDFIG